jgi:predicted transcriptional regulator
MAPRERTPKTLDNQDRKILAALQKNARLSNAELAEQIGMSTTACWNRARSSNSTAISTATSRWSTSACSATRTS